MERVFDLVKFFKNEIATDDDFHEFMITARWWMMLHGLSFSEKDVAILEPSEDSRDDITKNVIKYFVNEDELNDIDDLKDVIKGIADDIRKKSISLEIFKEGDFQAVAKPKGVLFFEEGLGLVGYLYYSQNADSNFEYFGVETKEDDEVDDMVINTMFKEKHRDQLNELFSEVKRKLPS